MNNILSALLWFAAIGGLFGILLAIASKVFAVKTDPRIDEIKEKLPGANCGGCGYAGCASLSEAIVKGEALPSKCAAISQQSIADISAIMGIEATSAMRMRAQVMCSGSDDLAKRKYIYEGINDCIAANKLGGGSKLCPNGCIGLGTCARSCKFGAIHVEKGVAAVDYEKCAGCGACVAACPKNIIKLIPFDAHYWVGCMSVEKGLDVRKFCDVGCIGCTKCAKNCEAGAIACNGFLASIDYELCTHCGKCAENCPRKIIWSPDAQKTESLVLKKESLNIN